jgi:hypothetical protein
MHSYTSALRAHRNTQAQTMPKTDNLAVFSRTTIALRCRQYEVLGDNVAETVAAIHQSSLVTSRLLLIREEGREEQQKIYKVTFFQCCGTESGIPYFFDLRIQDPG